MSDLDFIIRLLDHLIINLTIENSSILYLIKTIRINQIIIQIICNRIYSKIKTKIKPISIKIIFHL